jgi:hypothetical protein
MGKVTYRCKRGLKARDGRDVVKICRGEGSWDGPDIICDGKNIVVDYNDL